MGIYDHPQGSQERGIEALKEIRKLLPLAVISVKYDVGMGKIKPHYYLEVDP